MKKLFVYFPLLLVSGIALSQFAYTQYVKSQPIPDAAQYVGSAQCLDCHNNQHHQWQGSLHAKMMRPLSEVDDLQADISPEGDAPFDSSDIAWVIGSKWEQQFMGEEGGHETLLPGAWIIEKHEWMLQGWDGWQTPQPLERCHGCHTVGLDVESGAFVEPGIGCESCHGPGSWHVETDGNGKIYNSLEAQMCGQCHTRGKSDDGQHFFPVNYRPWQNLEAVFQESRPDPLQNTSHWWANGHARKRHQEYSAWKQGGHVNSLLSLLDGYDGRYGEVERECLTCHAAEASLAGANHDLSVSEVSAGITCAVCHNVHGELDKARVSCQQCHGEGAFWHQPERNLAHVPCPDSAGVQCVNCHMPLTGWNGGKYSLHSHTPGIVPPGDSLRYGVPGTCSSGGCHAQTDLNSLQKVFSEHYGEPGTH